MNKKIIDTCRNSLLQCVTDIGFVAGGHHFIDLWARDSLFASFAANVSGLSAALKKTIETFLLYQREDGLIPYLILRVRHTIGKYFGKHTFYNGVFEVYEKNGLPVKRLLYQSEQPFAWSAGLFLWMKKLLD